MYTVFQWTLLVNIVLCTKYLAWCTHITCYSQVIWKKHRYIRRHIHEYARTNTHPLVAFRAMIWTSYCQKNVNIAVKTLAGGVIHRCATTKKRAQLSFFIVAISYYWWYVKFMGLRIPDHSSTFIYIWCCFMNLGTIPWHWLAVTSLAYIH